ncbi:MAG TPA: thiamine pyrophosphate-binding protein [Candidatus Deferrimicrobium sp.]|nr:thiamine pyrophosphate-binding protein [Candidatus Deferrimicrobium sp.]
MKLTGGEIIVEYLRKERMPYVFGIPGHGCLGLTDALRKYKNEIKVIQMKQEMSGVHMADAYYRVTGRPLAVFTSIGPGAINTAIGLASAYVDSIPVLVITGDTHVHMRGKGVLQEIERRRDSDLPRVLEPIVKRSWQVAKVEQLPSVMQRAFNLMMTGRQGPVHIDLPMDVQCDSIDIDIPDIDHFKPQGNILGDPQKIKDAIALILSARRPVVLVGGGVVAAAAFQDLKEFAELVGAAVITTMMGKSAFPEDHPLYAWHTGSKGTTCGLKLSSTADVLIAIGCRFADETSSSYKQGVSFAIPPTKLIQVDIDPTEIGKNYPVKVGIIGDAKSVLQALVTELKEQGIKKNYEDKPYFKKIQTLKKDWFAFIHKFKDDSKVPVMISTVLQEVRKALARDAIVITSSGNIQAQMLQEFPFYEPKTCITTGGFSTMGYTVPATIGAKLAAPKRQVVGLVGDGDFMMTMQELATAVQYQLPILIVLVNNMGWVAISDLQRAVYGEDHAYATEFFDATGKLYSPDFKAIAEGFGCYAEKLTKCEEIQPSIKRALDSGKPAVLEIIVNRDFPYSGSPAHGWWDVPIPTYFPEKRAKYEADLKGEKI